MRDSTAADDWFEKADHDLEVAQVLYDNNKYTDIICFHAHQAIEKYLKGYLYFNGQMPRKIHNLEELLKDCSALQPKFLEYLDACNKITAYYIETHYPTPAASEYTRAEAQEAIEIARNIVELVEREIEESEEMDETQ